MNTEWLQTFAASEAGLALKALLLGTLLVAVLGIFAALRDGTFTWTAIDSFVRSTIWGRVAPVAVALMLAYALGEPLITGAAVAAAAAVGAGMVASALESLRQLTLPKEDSAARNVTPTG